MDHAVELRTAQARLVIIEACGDERPVTVSIKGIVPPQPLYGRLTRLTDEAVVAVLAGKIDDVPVLVNRYCEVTLRLGNGDYFFDSHIVASRVRGDCCELHMCVPSSIAVLQRRFDGRTTVAGCPMVQLSRHEYGKLHVCEGELANLSSTGLAVRVAGCAADELQKGSTWSACFELPGQEYVYKIDAVVTRKSCAGSDAMIVGICFERDCAEELRGIREFLGATECPSMGA